MTRNEAAIVIQKIRRLYVTQMGKYSRAELESMIDTWAETFSDESLDNVLRAVNVYARSGKPFAPNAPDIMNELIHLEEYGESKLFNSLRRAAQIAAEGEEHIVIDDPGGVVKDETSPTGWRYVVAEAHVSRTYTQADFANLPRIIQEYAEDIEGLVSLHNEIQSNVILARRRFLEAVPYIEAKMEAGS